MAAADSTPATDRLPFATRRGSTPKETIAEIVRLYSTGIGCTEIGRRLGLSGATALKWVHRAGLQTRRAGGRPNPTVRHDYFRAIDTDEKAWLLGFIGADGNVNHNTLRICLHERDREILERIRAIIAPDATIGERLKKNRSGKWAVTTTLAVNSVDMIADLNRHGIVPRKSLVYKPWDGPPHLMPAYFRGLLDGDGTWSRPKKLNRWQVRLCGTRETCEAFAGFVRPLVTTAVFVRPIRSIWAASVNGTAACQIIAKALYNGATISLARKQSKVNEMMTTRVIETRKWKGVTGDDLLRLRAECVSWAEVADRLNTSSAVVYKLCRGRGIPTDGLPGGRPFKWGRVTKGQLESLFAECGNWYAVADRLGMKGHVLVAVRRRLGMVGPAKKRTPRISAGAAS